MATTSHLRTIQALRVGLAASISLLIAESWHLPHANLAVGTTHIIMSSYTHTTFQKGSERFVGRTLGILLGMGVVSLVGEQKPLEVLIEVIVLLGCFYAHFVGRLAYTYMNAGLLFNLTLQYGATGPDVAYTQGGWMILEIAIGVGVSDLVSWLTWAERDFSFEPGAGRLLPVQPDLLGRAFQMTTTLLLAQYLFFALEVPPDTNTFALYMFSVMPDFHKLNLQHRYFAGGIIAGIGLGIVALLILNRVLHLPMLVALVFGVEFVASYIYQMTGQIKYIGYEMGQIFLLIAVVPAAQIQAPAQSFYMILAVFTFIAVGWVVGALFTVLKIVPASFESG